MIYIMVTNWDNHWDQLSDGQTYYTKKIMYGRITESQIENNTPTIFIKLNRDTKVIEKIWKGSVSNFSVESERVRFKVNIEKEIQCPAKYQTHKEGWYIDEAEIKNEQVEDLDIFPPFFEKIKTTKDWEEFEENTYKIFKLLGIHEIYKYLRQRGTADGFFKFKNLAVVYDATLTKDFFKEKEQQINNFCSMLNSGKVEHESNIIDVSNCNKQVWIVTQRVTQQIRKMTEVYVKEIAVKDLINIYEQRILENLSEDELEMKLRNI